MKVVRPNYKVKNIPFFLILPLLFFCLFSLPVEAKTSDPYFIYAFLIGDIASQRQISFDKAWPIVYNQALLQGNSLLAEKATRLALADNHVGHAI
jgi:hypothetical protein